MFCPRARILLQTQAPRLQFCPKAGLQPQTQKPRLLFYTHEKWEVTSVTSSSVWKSGKIHLLSPSISKMLNDKRAILARCWMTTHKTHPPRWPIPSNNKRKRERERNTRGSAHNLTHRNLTPFWWKNKYMSNIVVAGPCTIYFKWVLCLPGPR